jgi:hypothetical protein
MLHPYPKATGRLAQALLDRLALLSISVEGNDTERGDRMQRGILAVGERLDGIIGTA